MELPHGPSLQPLQLWLLLNMEFQYQPVGLTGEAQVRSSWGPVISGQGQEAMEAVTCGRGSEGQWRTHKGREVPAHGHTESRPYLESYLWEDRSFQKSHFQPLLCKGMLNLWTVGVDSEPETTRASGHLAGDITEQACCLVDTAPGPCGRAMVPLSIAVLVLL